MSGNIAGIFGQPYDTQNTEAMDNFDPLPAGWYSAEVDEADVVQTKAGNGWYLKLRFYIFDKPFNGRKIFRNINLANPNKQAEEIGQKELTSFGRAIGLPMVNDSSECLNKQLMVKLKITRDKEYGDGNDVTGYKPIGQAGAPAPAPAPQPQPPAPAYAAPAPQSAPTYAPPAQPAAPQAYAPPPAAAAPVQPPAGGMPWKRDTQPPF